MKVCCAEPNNTQSNDIPFTNLSIHKQTNIKYHRPFIHLKTHTLSNITDHTPQYISTDTHTVKYYAPS